jgi:hypothetical protein
MKKSILILSAAVSLLAYPAFGQTISVTGVNSTIAAASGSFVDIQLTLNITQTSGQVSNVESINMLLRTFAQGLGLNGAGLFSVVPETNQLPPTHNFTNGASSTFNTAADAANQVSGAGTVSDPSIDLGANTTSPVAVNSSGTTSIPFETIRFTSLANLTAGKIYNFSVTLGGNGDNQGSWIDNSNSATFDINSAPTFTITVVPEPATLSLLGLGGLGSLGLTLLRARRTS